MHPSSFVLAAVLVFAVPSRAITAASKTVRSLVVTRAAGPRWV
jgi:hypothetical protein